MRMALVVAGALALAACGGGSGDGDSGGGDLTARTCTISIATKGGQANTYRVCGDSDAAANWIGACDARARQVWGSGETAECGCVAAGSCSTAGEELVSETRPECETSDACFAAYPGECRGCVDFTCQAACNTGWTCSDFEGKPCCVEPGSIDGFCEFVK